VWDVEVRLEAALFECVSALDVERAALASESKGQARHDEGTSSAARDGGWFWSRSRGNVWATGEMVAAACAYEFVESALACRSGARAKRDVADSTNSSALLGGGEPAAASRIYEFTNLVLQVSDYVALTAQ
jgi:hypothetical protein